MMYELKIAVGLSGRIVVMKSFPDDEKHAGLHDLVDDFETETEVEKKPGLYIATVYVSRSEDEPDAILEISEIEPI